jgi:hypothetical protein
MYMLTLGICLDSRVFSECKKSLRLPIKRGARARVKGFTTFEARAVFRRFFVSSSFANCMLNLVFLCSYILVFGDYLRLFGPPPPTLAPIFLQPKKTTYDATAEEVEEEHSR